MEPSAPPSPVLVAPARVALVRGVIAAALLAVALPLTSLRTSQLAALEAATGIGLGLVVGLLTVAEHVARRGRPRLALAWVFAIAPLGVLGAATQASFVDQALGGGWAHAHERVHAAVWLVALDPLTLPTLAVVALTLALVPLHWGLAGRPWRLALLIGATSSAGGALATLDMLGAFDHVTLQPWVEFPGEPRFGLPLGPEATERFGGESEGTVGRETLRLAVVLALASWVAAAVADRVLRGRTAVRPDHDRRPQRAGALAGAALTCMSCMALGALAGRAPPATVLGAIEALPSSGADRALRRIGPADRELVPVLARALSDPRDPRCARLADALARIGRPADEATVTALVVALQARDLHVSRAARDAIGVLGAERAALLRLFREEAHDAVSWPSWEVIYTLGWLEHADYLALASDPDPVVARAAMDRIAGLGIADTAIPQLERLLPDPTVGDLAALTIANTGEPALALLRARLARSDVQWDPIVAVMHHLPQNPTALSLLREALASPYPAVRAAAAKGLRADGARGAWRGGADVLVERLVLEPGAADLVDALATYRTRGVAAIDSALTSDLAPAARAALEEARTRATAR